MEQVILTEAQKHALKIVAAEKQLERFYLTGGTALAEFYFHHRLSDDLDFFTAEEPDTIFLHAFANRLKDELGTEVVRYEHVHDRHQFFFKIGSDELKIEFSRYPFPQFEEPLAREGVRVDSLRDISANKLMALVDRFDPKDFVDLFFILQKTDIELVRSDTQKKFGITIGDILLGSELAKVRRIEALPKMLVPLTIEELKKFFEQQAKSLKPKILE